MIKPFLNVPYKASLSLEDKPFLNLAIMHLLLENKPFLNLAIYTTMCPLLVHKPFLNPHFLKVPHFIKS
jgi:hypothetical protein